MGGVGARVGKHEGTRAFSGGMNGGLRIHSRSMCCWNYNPIRQWWSGLSERMKIAVCNERVLCCCLLIGYYTIVYRARRADAQQ